MNESNKVVYQKVYEHLTAIAASLNQHEKELLLKLLQTQLKWESSLASSVSQEVEIKYPSTDDWVKDLLEKNKESKPFVNIGDKKAPIMYPDINLSDIPKPLDVRYNGEIESFK